MPIDTKSNHANIMNRIGDTIDNMRFHVPQEHVVFTTT